MYILQSAHSAHLIRFALLPVCASTSFFFPSLSEVDSTSFNNSPAQRTTSPTEREGSRDP